MAADLFILIGNLLTNNFYDLSTLILISECVLTLKDIFFFCYLKKILFYDDKIF